MPFSIRTCSEQERLLPLAHDARHEAMKLDANWLILGDAQPQVSVRNGTKNGILESDGCDHMYPRSRTEQAHEVASQRKGRNLAAFATGVHHGFCRSARNGKEMREWSTLFAPCRHLS